MRSYFADNGRRLRSFLGASKVKIDGVVTMNLSAASRRFHASAKLGDFARVSQLEFRGFPGVPTFTEIRNTQME